MTLKDIIERDVDQVFFNLADFNKELTIDGMTVLADVEDEGEGEDGHGRSEGRDGVTVQVQTIYVPLSLISRPDVYQEWNIDDELWLVSKVSEEHGVLSVQCYREGS